MPDFPSQVRRHCRSRWLVRAPAVFVAIGMLCGASGVLFVDGAEQESIRTRPLAQGLDFEREVAQFLDRYRRLPDCCVTNLDALEQVKALEGQASALLSQAQTGLPAELQKLRSFALGEMMTPVEQARDGLREIRKLLVRIRKEEDKLATQDPDFFTFWTEHRKVRDALEAITSKIRSPKRPTGQPTGVDIGVTLPTGPEAGTVPPTGSDIGTVPPTGSDIGTTPPTGKDIGVTPPTGTGIGTVPPTGPAIGESHPR
jgi:hypothetical protein